MNVEKILAIETSGELCSVALSLSENKFDERNIQLKHIHSEKLIPMIDEIFSSNNISASNLDALAISTGPGSFTGLRIGMTAAKGIAFAANLPIIPVPTFEALSLEISTFLIDGTTFSIINNANIDECYFAKYKIENNNILTIVDTKLIEKNKINEIIDSSDMIFGNISIVENIKSFSSPRAISIAKWVYLFGQDLLTFDYDYLEPNYLKNFKVRQNK